MMKTVDLNVLDINLNWLQRLSLSDRVSVNLITNGTTNEKGVLGVLIWVVDVLSSVESNLLTVSIVTNKLTVNNRPVDVLLLRSQLQEWEAILGSDERQGLWDTSGISGDGGSLLIKLQSLGLTSNLEVVDSSTLVDGGQASVVGQLDVSSQLDLSSRGNGSKGSDNSGELHCVNVYKVNLFVVMTIKQHKIEPQRRI